MIRNLKELIKEISPQTAERMVVSLKGLSDVTRSAISVSEKSKYSDPEWSLTAENPDLHPANVTLRLSRIFFDDGTDITYPCKAHYLRSTREYLFSMLADPPSSSPKWSTVCGTYHKGVARLLRYMHKNAFLKFSDLGPTDLEDFLDLVSSESVKGNTAINNRALQARVSGLNWLYEQTLKIEDGLQCNPFGHYGSASNWANACCQKQIPRHGSRTVEMPDEIARQVFCRALEDLAISETLQRLHDARLDYNSSSYSSKKRFLNPFPWHDFGMISGKEIVRWEARLATACYIVIAMLTGMRWHELVSLRVGERENWLEEEIVHEEIQRTFYFVLSYTNKLQAEPVQYKWQTLPIVKLALNAAELGLARRRKGGKFLFPSYRTEGTRTSDSASGANFRRFVDVHNIFHNGKLWPLASHQFRKKYARIMTRQGLGLKELQDQLKHFDIEMTRGYGDMNLYVELQEEKFILSGEQYTEMMQSQQRYVGGGGEEMDKLQKTFLGMTKGQQETLLKELPRSALIEQMDDGLCMYRSKHALCGGDAAACRPADCNNALIPITGKRKSFTWRINENNRLLRHFCKQPSKVAYLEARNVELHKLIVQIDHAEASK